MKKILAGVLLTGFSIYAADKLPNYRWEERLNLIYQDIKDRKMSEEEWQSLMEGKDTDSYVIQAGDSLWDVSKTIFGTGFFWPKLWQLNSKLTNPHELSVGHELRFVDLGMEGPSILTGETEAPEEINSAAAEKLALTEDEFLELNWKEPEIPPAKQKRPALREMPPSLYDWRVSNFNVNDMPTSIEAREAEILKRKKYFVEYYATSKEVEGVGYVQALENGEAELAATYEYVYVYLPQAGVGDEFIGVKSDEKRKIKLESGTSVSYYPVEIEAKIKIIETIDVAKSIHKAIVLKSLKGLAIGAKLLPGDFPYSTWGIDGNYLDIKAEIIGGRFDENRMFFGLGSVVYLNKGTKDGVNKDSLLHVLKNPDLREKKLLVDDAPLIGRLKIIDSQEDISTALVVSSTSEIRVGDITGQPIILQMGQ